MMNNDFSLEHVADRMEIQHRIYSYSRGVDRLDLELAKSAFHPDAIDDHGVYKGNVEGMIEWIKERHKTIPLSFHSIGNIFIEFAGPDDALCESYCFVWQTVTPESSLFAKEENNEPAGIYETLTINRYVDHFTRRDGAWRIQKRTTVVESWMQVPGSPNEIGSEWTESRRDLNDVSQLLRAKLGIAQERI
jgi:hypothetical protein